MSLNRKIWLISDTHFGHDNMCFFRASDGERVRPFNSAAVVDEMICDLWSQLVDKDDIIYHLGDVAMERKFIATVKKLPGRKRLILGNHDRFSVNSYLEVGFEKLMGSRRFENVILSHIPLHPLSISHKLIGNIHGHIHREPSFGPRWLNVSVEQTNYAPIELTHAIQLLSSQQQEPTHDL